MKNQNLCVATGEDKNTEALLLHQNTETTSQFASGAENMADLILSRGDAEWNWKNLQLDNTFVCKKHANELGYQFSKNLPKVRFRSGRKYRCTFPEVDGKHSHGTTAVAAHLFLTKTEARAVFERKQKLVPVGLRKHNFLCFPSRKPL